MADLSHLDRLIADLPETVSAALDEAAAASFVVALRHIHPVSGELGKSLGMKKTGLFCWTIGTDKPYAGFVENGRGAVHARPGGVLRFVINGEVLFRKSVGPAKARPFLAPAQAYFDAHASAYVERALRRLAA